MNIFLVGVERVTRKADPEYVGPRGGEARVTIEPFYCEEVPGDCFYNAQYRVGEISTFTATVHNSDQGMIVECGPGVGERGEVRHLHSHHGSEARRSPSMISPYGAGGGHPKRPVHPGDHPANGEVRGSTS